MAKKSTNDRGRIRVFFAEFEGDDETIQEGLKAMSVAVAKAFQPNHRIVKYLPPTGANEPDPELDGDEVEDVLVGVDSLEGQSPSQKSVRGKRKPASMTLVKDLNVKPDGKESLQEFYESKHPKSQQEKIAVFVYYLKQILELEKVSANHVYTCFKDVKVRPPTDVPQSIRNTAFRKGWVESNDQDDLKITTRGITLVEHDLPRKGE